MILYYYILLSLVFTILGLSFIRYYTNKRAKQLHHQISSSEKYFTLRQPYSDEEKQDNSLGTTDTHYGGGGGGNFKYKFPGGGGGKIEFGGGAGFDYKHGKHDDDDDNNSDNEN
ncbi:conserved hypothetical protein [Candida dubliniensis CD36]|uniref:Uncharacterized protein n=1 Tax=Candida dubliniensis (strain CD36 / ATCC MYA-646 / CBS 7987 / NCPF 3949 / NRRL Y-17841) TaxID=573826 RepID=B9W835_CANDC|nr:conserved hypothetical protein [Candida dubliniensis CD36]CAX44865.1 conserved hypothetical protein [Candida dubliniensis CD36]